MTIVTFPRHRRRIIAICAATVALHFVAINWVSGRIGAAERERDAEKNIIQAELRLAPPPAPAEVKPAEPPPPKPKPRRAPKPVPPPAAPVMPVVPVTPDAGEAPPPAEPAPAAAGPATPAPASQADAPPAPAAVESVPEEKAAAVHWKVALPPSARFEMDVKRKDADGTNWSGSGSMGWRLDGASYQVTQEAGLSLLIARVSLMQVSSEGTVNETGIVPATFSQKVRNRSATATHFNQQEQTITFSASTRSVPLMAGAQDRATLPFQLAGIGRADVSQLGKDIDILVGDDRDAQVYRFQLVGEEELDTKMGKLASWHLVRPPKPGSYSSQLDIWLAPSQDWYPVQIRNTERSGAVTTQIVTRIIK